MIPENNNQKFTFKLISIIGTALGFVIIVALIVGGSLLSSRRWDPTWNPFRQKVEKSFLRKY